jgi:geranylgeranyl pyrophosphate synthase|mmetsp:Transcript_6813/g.10970  ORF Transcript_6813/g.10970 Transcript_6813/m.10970 type:complete len:488 (+) Transcript_6813:51-1514(+)
MHAILVAVAIFVHLSEGRRVAKNSISPQEDIQQTVHRQRRLEDSALNEESKVDIDHANIDEIITDGATKELASFLLAFNVPPSRLDAGARVENARMTQATTATPVMYSKGTVVPTKDSQPRLAWPNADLTPAVEKFATVPSETDLESDMPMRATGPKPEGPDPFQLVANDLQSLSQYVSELMSSENPILTQAATLFFDSKERQGKRFRPTIVALLSRTIADGKTIEDVKQRQLQLGQITEMIHVASLIHDDVLDEAEMRRGGEAVHTKYNNKVAVLAGDHLLARASMLLARLQHSQVVEVMASALDSLVQGEMLQALSKKDALLEFKNYLQKSYYKTASLISCSCKSAALLAGYEENDEETIAAEEFGYHLGMAYQIVDDILDFTGASATLGKPAQADMELGLATAPILYASEVQPSLKPLILRKFKKGGDVVKAVGIAKDTDCVAKSYKLAEFHAKRGLAALHRLPENESRQALEILMHKALARSA